VVVDDERCRWHDIIVPHRSRLILLDFPELAQPQGKARRRSLPEFLLSASCLAAGRRRANHDRTRRTLHSRTRRFRRGRSGPTAFDGIRGLCNATSLVAASGSDVCRPAPRRLDSQHDLVALAAGDREEKLLSAITDGAASGGNRVTRTELPSGTVTFLFTDIEGSTRLLARLGHRCAANQPTCTPASSRSWR
jgi:hypothetical protein